MASQRRRANTGVAYVDEVPTPSRSTEDASMLEEAAKPTAKVYSTEE